MRNNVGAGANTVQLKRGGALTGLSPKPRGTARDKQLAFHLESAYSRIYSLGRTLLSVKCYDKSDRHAIIPRYPERQRRAEKAIEENEPEQRKSSRKRDCVVSKGITITDNEGFSRRLSDDVLTYTV